MTIKAENPLHYVSIKSSEEGNKNNDGAKGTDAIAIGPNASAAGASSTAIGAGNAVKAGADNSNAIGTNNSVGENAVNATAIGSENTVSNKASYASAVGYKNTATGVSSFAAGDQSEASGVKSIATGYMSEASGASSLAMGDTAIATGANSFAMGTQACADGNQSLALGYRSHSKFDDGVALGSDSVASRDKGSLGFLAKDSDVGSSTWQSTRAAVSVGDPANGITRQITGVAAGSEDTDAVNVAQLKTVDRRLDKVGAMAAAFSALQPLGYDEQHPTTLSLGYGGYSGKGAVALGISHYLNRDVLLNGGMSISGEEKSFRFGASFRLGMSPRRLNADGKTVRVSSTEMEALQKVSDLEKTVNDLRKRLNALEAEKKK
ncbi:Hep/Hag repeat protein [Jonquetella anthropi E3_33 E1]|nr:Hep/Hag repeat protein [Jonquetella anthropi E3_33 E1]